MAYTGNLELDQLVVGDGSQVKTLAAGNENQVLSIQSVDSILIPKWIDPSGGGGGGAATGYTRSDHTINQGETFVLSADRVYNFIAIVPEGTTDTTTVRLPTPTVLTDNLAPILVLKFVVAGSASIGNLSIDVVPGMSEGKAVNYLIDGKSAQQYSDSQMINKLSLTFISTGKVGDGDNGYDII